MASPFKTAETMDLARALREDDSTPCMHTRDGDDYRDRPDSSTFRSLVVTKESSTELIPTQRLVPYEKNGNRPALMRGVVKDLNAGKGMLDDDGRPAVGKVFSRVIHISPNDKPKQLKVRRGTSKKDVGCTEAGCTSNRQRSGLERRQSSETLPFPQRTSGPATISNVCPACNRQFSDDSMRHHLVFCNGSSKDLM